MVMNWALFVCSWKTYSQMVINWAFFMSSWKTVKTVMKNGVFYAGRWCTECSWKKNTHTDKRVVTQGDDNALSVLCAFLKKHTHIQTSMLLLREMMNWVLFVCSWKKPTHRQTCCYTGRWWWTELSSCVSEKTHTHTSVLLLREMMN